MPPRLWTAPGRDAAELPCFSPGDLDHLVGGSGQLERVAVRIPEKQAATTAPAVQLPVADLIRLAAVRHAFSVEPFSDAVQLAIVDEQGEGTALEVLAVGVGVVDVELVVELHRRETGKRAAILAAQDVTEEQGRAELIRAENDCVIELDCHRVPRAG